MFVRFAATGQFNGEDGWSKLAHFSDFGEPGVGKRDAGNLSDAVRFTLIDPYSNLVYDTSLFFHREQVWRTLLDGGNLTFHCEDEASAILKTTFLNYEDMSTQRSNQVAIK